MAWQIGIDEAGYGPNLGPLVMTVVACRVPDDLLEANLWDALKSAVRRAGDDADHRLIVADSKQVYAPARGWQQLERTALAVTACISCVQHLLEKIAAEELGALRQEAWFVGDTAIPTEVAAEELTAACALWIDACHSVGVEIGFCQSAIVAAPRFNDLVDKWESKGAVLGIAITDLLRRCLSATAAEPMRFVVDKHGGRNTYSALFQHAFSDGFVFAQEEGMLRSVYRVEGLDRSVQVLVTPRADVEHFTVALASMISKYVRELLMREFNRFWQSHVPGLEPTAGYPGDAARYFKEIRPALRKLGIDKRLVWRCR